MNMNIKNVKHNSFILVIVIAFLLSYNYAHALSKESIVSKMLEYLNNATISEDGYVSFGTHWTEAEKMDSEVKEFYKNSWPLLLENFSKSAPSERDQYHMIAIAELLEPEDYLNFLKGFLTQLEAGSINEKIIKKALRPMGIKDQFLQINYDHPKVREICQRAKKFLVDDEEFQGEMNKILKGDLEVRLQALRCLSSVGRSLPPLLTEDTLNLWRFYHTSDPSCFQIPSSEDIARAIALSKSSGKSDVQALAEVLAASNGPSKSSSKDQAGNSTVALDSKKQFTEQDKYPQITTPPWPSITLAILSILAIGLLAFRILAKRRKP
jgi:hypothetical protein